MIFLELVGAFTIGAVLLLGVLWAARIVYRGYRGATKDKDNAHSG